MLSTTRRRSFADFVNLVERHGVVATFFISAVCAVYLMHNIWTARTLFVFVVLPLALVSFSIAELKAVARTPIFLTAAAYFVFLTIAALMVGDPNIGFIVKHAYQSLLVLSFIAIAAILAHRDRRFPSACLLAVGIAGALKALVDMAVYYHSIHWIWTQRLEGTPGISMYYNSNVVGGMYAIAFAAAAGVAVRGGYSRTLSALSGAMAVVLFVAVLLSGSRGALLAVLMSVLVLLMLGVGWRMRLAFFAAAIFGSALLLGFSPFFKNFLFRGDSYRLWLWRTYFDLAMQQPWFGYGLSTDVSVDLPENAGRVPNAHNIILSALVRGGIPSAVALITVIAVSLREGWRAAKIGNAPLPLTMLAAGIGLTAVDYEIIASPLGWPWLFLWLPVALSLGSGWRASELNRDSASTMLAGATPATQ